MMNNYEDGGHPDFITIYKNGKLIGSMEYRATLIAQLIYVYQIQYIEGSIGGGLDLKQMEIDTLNEILFDPALLNYHFKRSNHPANRGIPPGHPPIMKRENGR